MITRNPLFLRDEEIDRSLELLLLAERDIMAQLHEHLARDELGEVDFRVLYLVERHPGVTTAELCGVIGMSKQSLSRHVKHLVALGFLRIDASRQDRRKRPLFTTDASHGVLAAVAKLYKKGLRRAFSAAGPDAVQGFQQVLGKLVDGPGRNLLPRGS